MIKLRMMRQAGPVLQVVTRKAYRVLVQKFEGKRFLQSPTHRWEYIKMDLIQGMRIWMDSSGSELGCCEHSNETCSVRGEAFLEYLRQVASQEFCSGCCSGFPFWSINMYFDLFTFIFRLIFSVIY